MGDFDVDAMERQIREAFGDWQPKAPDGPEPDLGRVEPRGLETDLNVAPGFSSSVNVAWVRAPDLRADTVEARRQEILRGLIWMTFRKRLEIIAHGDDPPFITAQGLSADAMRSIHITMLAASFVEGNWQKALRAVEMEQRRLVQFGVTEQELARDIDRLRTTLRNSAMSAATRDSRGLANGIVDAVNNRKVVTSPQQDLDAFEAAVKGVTAAEVNALIAPMFEGNGPLIAINSSKPIAGGDAAVRTAFVDGQKLAVAAPVPPIKRAWPYGDFGPAGTVVERRELAGLGATEITFANGVRLMVKPTDFDKDAVNVTVRTGRGNQSFSPDGMDPRSAAMATLTEGGLGKLSYDELRESLSGRSLQVSQGIGDDAFELSGTTIPGELPTEMQLLAAYVSDPALRPTPWETLKQQYPMQLELRQSTPSASFGWNGSLLLAGGDQRLAHPKPAELASWKIETMRDDLRKLIRGGPVRIVIVGDTTVDKAIAAVASTFGAMPVAVPAAIAPNGDQRHFPAPTAVPIDFTHTGPAEQALGYIAWPTTDSVKDWTEARRLGLLAAVLKIRVTEEVRERLAISYSPGVAARESDDFPGYGMISAQAQTRPEQLKAFFDAMDRLTAELRDKPVSADMLKRAREPLVEDVRRRVRTNGYWREVVATLLDKPDMASQAMTEEALLEAMTPADIQALARKYLVTGKAWKAKVKSSAAKAAPLK